MYFPRDQQDIQAKNKLLQKAKKICKGREKIIERFKNGIFTFGCDDDDSRFKHDDENDIRNRNGLIDHKKLNRLIDLKRRTINYKLFTECFSYQNLTSMLKDLNSTKNTEVIKIQVALTKSVLTNFKNKIKNMFENEIKFEQPNERVHIVEKILEFNKQGGRLKLLMPFQMLSRLLIFLAQLNTGNNSEKLKNEIRQLLYSLYRSKKLRKNIYKSLVDIIQNMETIFMNIKNSKTSKPQRFRLNLTDKPKFKDP